MAFTKVDEAAIRAAGVVPLTDSPTLPPAQLKAKFDEKGDMALDAFNNHIDEITADTAASNIGATVPTGVTASATIQSILGGLALLAVAADSVKHSHENKTVLDGITSGQLAGYDALVTNYSGISPVTTLSVLSNTSIPTCKAVADYITGLSYTTFDTVHPVGEIVLCESGVSPASLYGRGTWTSQGDVGSFTAYKRTA